MSYSKDSSSTYSVSKPINAIESQLNDCQVYNLATNKLVGLTDFKILLHNENPLILYGTGGNGKSTLLKIMEKEMNELMSMTVEDAKKFATDTDIQDIFKYHIAVVEEADKLDYSSLKNENTKFICVVNKIDYDKIKNYVDVLHFTKKLV